MGSGRYIGRVGVLAVTLGVGVAIAQPTGMAWAEDTTTADSAEAQTAEGVDTASSEPTTGSRDTAAADTGSTAPSQASTTTVTDGHTTTTVGGDGAPKVTISGTTIDTTDDEATLPTAKAKPTATVENRSPSRPSRQTEKPKRNPSLVSAPASAASPVAVSRGAAGTEVSQVRTQRPAAAPVAATVQVTGAPTVAADSAPLKTRVTQPAPAPVTSSTTLVSNVLDVVSTALLGGGPQSPVDSPAMWALLAVARSRFGQPASGQRVASVPAGAPLSTSESFTLAAVNQPPTTRYFAGYPNATTGVVTGSVTATDKDRDPLTFTGPAGGASAKGGTVVVDAKGKFTYTPTLAARHGAARTGATAADKVDTFTVTVDDGQGHTVEQAVTVKVSPLKVAATVNHTNPNTGLATGAVTTANAGVYTYKTTTSRKGTLSVAADGSFTYTPTAAARAAASQPRASAYLKTDTFTITVTDAAGKRTTARLTVAIAPTGHVNEPPNVADPVVGEPDGDGVVTGSAATTDPERDPLTYSGSTTTTKGSVVVNPGGSFVYTPTAQAMHNASASNAAATGADRDTFTVVISDGQGGQRDTEITVSILPRNDVPTGVDVSVGQPNQSSGIVTGTVTATDPNNDGLTCSGSTTTTKGNVTVNPGGGFTYTPNPTAMHNASATNAAATGADKDTFTVTIDDGHGGLITKQVTVTIQPKNDAPTNAIASVGQPNQSSGIVTGTITATDPNNDGLTYSGSTTTTKGSVTVNPGGGFTYTPNPTAMHNASATNAAATGADKDTFTVTIDDGHGGLITKQVTVTIQPQNAGPTSAPVYNGFANGVHYGSTGSADADGDTLTYQITGAATNGTASIDQTLGTYTYVATSAARNAAANTPGTDTDSFTFTVSDGHGGLITKTVTVEIMPTGVITDIPKATGSSTMYVSPDGGRVLMTTRDSSTGTTRTKVTVYNSSTSGAVGTPVFVDGDTPSVFFTPDGTAAVVRTTNGNTTTFAAITLANGSLRGGGAASVTGNAEHRFDADSKTVVVAGENYSGSTAFTNFAILTPTTTSTFTVNAAGGYGGGWVVQLSPDRARAVAAIDRYDDTGITYAIVNTATGEVLSTPTLVGDEYMLGLTFAGNGRVVLSTKTYPDVDDPTVRMAVFNTVTGAAVGPVRTLTGYEMSVPAVSPTGNRVVLGTHPGNALQTTIMIVDTATGAIVGGAPTVLNDFATGAQFNADGTKVFLPTWINPSIKTIDATTGAVVATTPTYSGYGRGVVWNDDRTRGLFIVETTTGDTLVVPFNATTGTAISSGVTISGKLEGGDLRPDGQRMTFYTETQTYNSATGLYDTIARVSVLNVSSGALVNSVTIFSGPSTNSAVSFVDSGVGPNNRVVVAYSSRTNATDGASSIAVIDTTNGTIVGTPLQLSTYGGYASRPQMSTNGVGAVMWAAEGYDFTANKYTGIKLIAANTQTGRITVAPTANDIYDLRVSADGSRAAGATSTATATETTSQVTVVNTSTGTVSTTSYTGTDKAVLNFTASGLQVSVPTATGMRIYLIPG